MKMELLDVSGIESWHAHVYFDAASRDAARKFREVVNCATIETARFGSVEAINWTYGRSADEDRFRSQSDAAVDLDP